MRPARSASKCHRASSDAASRAVRRAAAGDDPTAMGLGNDDAVGRCRRRPPMQLAMASPHGANAHTHALLFCSWTHLMLALGRARIRTMSRTMKGLVRPSGCNTYIVRNTVVTRGLPAPEATRGGIKRGDGGGSNCQRAGGASPPSDGERGDGSSLVILRRIPRWPFPLIVCPVPFGYKHALRIKACR